MAARRRVRWQTVSVPPTAGTPAICDTGSVTMANPMRAMSVTEWARRTAEECRAAGFIVMGGGDSVLVKPPAAADVARMIKFRPTLPCIKQISGEGMLLMPDPASIG